MYFNFSIIMYLFINKFLFFRHLHSEVCRIASGVHNLFELHMTLQMVSYFYVLIAMLYFQYHTMLCLKEMYGGDSIRLKLILCSDIWLIIILIKVISFNHVCENVSAKVSQISLHCK